MDASESIIQGFYGKKKRSEVNGSPKHLSKLLEEALCLPKEKWSAVLSRCLWPKLLEGMTRKGRTLEHEVAWLWMSGFVLRPGTGYIGDDERINALWRLRSIGMSYPREPRVLDRWWILWRRISAGLTAERQEILFDDAEKLLNRTDYSKLEVFKALSTMERLPVEKKSILGDKLVRQFLKGKSRDIMAWCLGRVASRIPFYASSDTVLPQEMVLDWFQRLSVLDWREQKFNKLVQTFVFAFRKSSVESVNLAEDDLKLVVRKLQEAGCSEDEMKHLYEFEAFNVYMQSEFYGDSLPQGLRLM